MVISAVGFKMGVDHSLGRFIILISNLFSHLFFYQVGVADRHWNSNPGISIRTSKHPLPTEQPVLFTLRLTMK